MNKEVKSEMEDMQQTHPSVFLSVEAVEAAPQELQEDNQRKLLSHRKQQWFSSNVCCERLEQTVAHHTVTQLLFSVSVSVVENEVGVVVPEGKKLKAWLITSYHMLVIDDDHHVASYFVF